MAQLTSQQWHAHLSSFSEIVLSNDASLPDSELHMGSLHCLQQYCELCITIAVFDTGVKPNSGGLLGAANTIEFMLSIA